MSDTISPVPTLATARLRLTPLSVRDADSCLALLSDPEVVRHVGFGPFAERAQVVELLQGWDMRQAAGEELRWGVRRIDGGELIGMCSLKGPYSARRRAEVGYLLAGAYWGQGLAGEAVRALLDYSFGPLHLNRVEALVFAENEASRKLLSRLGFTQEGYLRQHAWEKGRFWDDVIYALLAEEYTAGAVTA